MKVHRNIDSLPTFRNAVVTIGTFDGVHLGHRQIILQLKEEAAKIQGETVIITFHPHPRKIVGLEQASVFLLNTPEEKTALLEEQGIDHLVVVPFTQDFANQTAEEYIQDFLIRYFNPSTLIIGYDHRFGKGRKGDFHLLEKYSVLLGFRLIEIPQHLLNQSAISSTRIRESLLTGMAERANELLGYPYFFEGKVIEGNKLGRKLGYPTANLEISNNEKLVPCNGVYAVTVVLKDEAGLPFKGMMNIGVRPTINGHARVIEVHLFDFERDIYGKTIRVHLRAFLRPEQKFDGLDALKAQLDDDKMRAMEVLE